MEILQKISYFQEDTDRNFEKIIDKDGYIIWESRDLFDTPEDATLDRDMTNAEDICQLLLKFEGKKIEFLEDRNVDNYDDYYNAEQNK